MDKDKIRIRQNSLFLVKERVHLTNTRIQKNISLDLSQVLNFSSQILIKNNCAIETVKYDITDHFPCFATLETKSVSNTKNKPFS